MVAGAYSAAGSEERKLLRLEWLMAALRLYPGAGGKERPGAEGAALLGPGGGHGGLHGWRVGKPSLGTGLLAGLPWPWHFTSSSSSDHLPHCMLGRINPRLCCLSRREEGLGPKHYNMSSTLLTRSFYFFLSFYLSFPPFFFFIPSPTFLPCLLPFLFSFLFRALF